jgi:hypothetical protein
MNEKKSVFRSPAATLVALLVLLSSLPALAQTGPETMSFQGRLLDSGGNPRGGETHCMGFRLCSDSSCTTQVWPASGYEEQAVITESGTHKAGLFTVALGAVSPIPPRLMFDADTLYLEIGVADETSCPGSTWTTLLPRSQLRANAYAQRSRRVRTEESDDDFLVSVGNTGQGGGIFARTDSTTDEARAGYFYAAASSGRTYGVYGRTDSTTTDASAVYGEASQASGQVYGLYGKTGSADGYGVYGSGPQVGVRGVGDTAGSVSPGVDVGVWGDSATGDGVWGVTGSSADQSTGVRGWANATSGATYGVYGYNRSSSAGARGVYGYSSAATDQLTFGVYGESASTSGFGVYGADTAASGFTCGVYGLSASTEGRGVVGAATADSGSTYGVWGLSTSTYGTGVYGRASATSGYTYGVFGESAWVGVKGIGGSASSVATAGDVGVWGDSNSGDGVWGTTDYTANNSSGVFGWAKGSSGQTSGVWGYNDSAANGARGVYGYAAASNGRTIGVRGESLSSGGTGVYGTASMTGTVGIATNVIGQGVGVYGKSLADSGVGVYAKAAAYSGQTYGVYSVNNSSGDNAAAGFFWAKGSSGLNSGVYGANASTSDWAAGGRFWATGASGQTFGVFGGNDSSTTNATGVYGLCTQGATNGVWGESQSTDGGSAGVYAYASKAGGSAVALWARSAGMGDIIRGYGPDYPDLEFRVVNNGDVRADGAYTSPAADFAEMLPAVAGLEPGDVLAIGPDGTLVRSSQAYQGTVAGVYSTRPGFVGGGSMDGEREGKVPLAVVGVAPVKASAENGPIRPGDLLAASSTPGHAMRAGENPPQGTVIGKALAGLESGVGVIQMLVTLQ